MNDKTTGLRCHDADACAMGQKPCPTPGACGCAAIDERDTFQGDNDALRRSIRALLRLDAKGALYPHGIGGHARALLISAEVRIAGLEAHLSAIGAGGVESLRKGVPAQEHATQLAGQGQAYSIDADPEGIRARVADAIAGALAFGAQGGNTPPPEHWLTPFWMAARFEAAQINALRALMNAQPAVAAPAQAQEDARDTERLDFMIESGAKVETVDPNDLKYLTYPDGWIQIGPHTTARAAIDAARTAQGGEA